MGKNYTRAVRFAKWEIAVRFRPSGWSRPRAEMRKVRLAIGMDFPALFTRFELLMFPQHPSSGLPAAERAVRRFVQ